MLWRGSPNAELLRHHYNRNTSRSYWSVTLPGLRITVKFQYAFFSTPSHTYTHRLFCSVSLFLLLPFFFVLFVWKNIEWRFECALPWEWHLIEGSVALLEEMYHCGDGLWDSPPSCLKTVCFCHVCLPAAVMFGWTSEPVNQPQLNVVLYRSCLGHCVFSQQ